MKKHVLVQWIICLTLPVALSLLLLVPRFREIDYTIYDLMLGLRPAIQESPEILLLNIDDDAIARVGTWPWSRAVLADGLLHLGEFGAALAVFDIEYVDSSPMGVSPEVLNENYPSTLNSIFNGINQDTQGLFQALQDGMIPLEEAEDFILQLIDINEARREELLTTARAIARDNDEYHGTAAGLFGRAYYTTTILESEELALPGTEDAAEYAQENFKVSNLDLETVLFRSGNTVQPVILPIARGAAGAGFPNVPVDPDGVRRRIDLIQGDGTSIYAQLALRPLLDYLGNPELVYHDRSVRLNNAVYPDGSVRDIRIPRTSDGRMLINWPPRSFSNTFRQLSYSRIYTLDQYETDLVTYIEVLTEARFLTGHQMGMELHPWYQDIQEIRRLMFEREDPELYQQYVDERVAWFAAVEEVFQPDTIRNYTSQIDRLLDREDLEDDRRRRYTEVRDIAVEQFDTASSIATDLLQQRVHLQNELEDSFIIIGWTGVSTTDIGVNPFDEQYMNVGTHAAVANTILQRNFLVELPYVFSIIAAFVLTILIGFLVKKTSARKTTIIGVGMLLIVSTSVWMLFAGTGMYLRPAVIIFSVGLAFIALSLLKFYSTEGEKRYISSAFSRYLSQDVVQEIINDPSKLNLGGEKREMTAIFTDVKGFSTISEMLDPQDLVRLLNRYLSAMSNIILELGGTIDKYEGDAIIAFFGAPLSVPDHAHRACLAAVRMKEKEKELNRIFIEEGASPNELMTRIGINTGEMVVGNMGTERMMDYTMMGHNVNLAARLEGVNKQYGSWILASENTIEHTRQHNSLNTQFVFRRLDRVRVVGVSEPVRLYEVYGEKDSLTNSDMDMLELFDHGIELFERADFNAAQERFTAAAKLQPEDGPTKTYKNRCSKFQETPPPANWDGVFSLTQK